MKVEQDRRKKNGFSKPHFLLPKRNVRGVLAKPGGLCNPERGGGLTDAESVAGTESSPEGATSSVAYGDSFPSEGKP